MTLRLPESREPQMTNAQNGHTRMRPPIGKPASLTDLAKTAAEDLLDLVAVQLKLARAELTADLKVAVGRAASVLLFVPPIVVGYVFAMAALAAWLSEYWGRVGALGAVAGLQIVGGVVGVMWSLARLKRINVTARAASEVAAGVQRTLAVVATSKARPHV
jgi:hypothetical protein